VSLDLGRLQAEINEEVRRRRAAGDFPPGLERELDAMFARYAPAGTGDDFDQVLLAAETQSFIHADVPIDSRIVALQYVKKALRKAMGWYVRFLAQEVTAFAGAVTRAVHLLDDRVKVLETVTVVAGERSLNEIRVRPVMLDTGPLAPLAVSILGGAPGRVLHTECGTGAVLTSLAEVGTDVYGVEPVESLALPAAAAGLDVRVDGALTHLRALPDQTLGGLLLSGCVDNLPLGEVLEVADRAAAVLAPGGTVLVFSMGPAAWSRSLDPVMADLAPGRPLHPETWVQLLARRGFDGVEVRPQPGAPPLAPVAEDVPGAAVLNANIERLNQVLFEPGPYAVVARKSPAR
jgi:hypothetical protein